MKQLKTSCHYFFNEKNVPSLFLHYPSSNYQSEHVPYRHVNSNVLETRSLGKLEFGVLTVLTGLTSFAQFSLILFSSFMNNILKQNSVNVVSLLEVQ